MMTYRIIKAALKHHVISREQLLFLVLEAYGANFRAVNKQLAESRKLEAALKFMGHPDTSEIVKNRGVDLVLTCGLCEECRVKANAVTYIRNSEDEKIDQEFERREKAWKAEQDAQKKQMEKEFGGLI